jgi:hypothetical protein
MRKSAESHGDLAIDSQTVLCHPLLAMSAPHSQSAQRIDVKHGRPSRDQVIVDALKQLEGVKTTLLEELRKK